MRRGARCVLSLAGLRARSAPTLTLPSTTACAPRRSVWNSSSATVGSGRNKLKFRNLATPPPPLEVDPRTLPSTYPGDRTLALTKERKYTMEKLLAVTPADVRQFEHQRSKRFLTGAEADRAAAEEEMREQQELEAANKDGEDGDALPVAAWEPDLQTVAGPLALHHQWRVPKPPVQWRVHFDPDGNPVAPIGPNDPVPRYTQIDDKGRAYGTGRRKTSTARVWIKPGSGAMYINRRLAHDYFPDPIERAVIQRAFRVTETVGQFDLFAMVEGGGKTGQAGAVLMGSARALQAYNPGYRHLMKPHGFLRRDDRMVEAKKFGRKKARKRFQWHKR